MKLRGLSLAIAIGVSVADPVAQDRQDREIAQQTAADRQSIVALFEALDHGRAPRLTIERPFDFHDSFESAAASWVEAGPETDRQRRRDVVAIAVLETARGITIGGNEVSQVLSWPAVKKLIEWQCDRLRRGPPTEFERRWMIASAAVIHAAGDSRFLMGTFGIGTTRFIIKGRLVEGTQVPCHSTELCNHAAHIESRFPGDPQVALARVMLESGIARKPGSLAGRIASSKLTKGADGAAVTPGLEAMADAAVAELRRLSDDPTVGWDARLRLGLVLFGLNQRAQSLQELEQVAASTATLEVRYVALFASALNHDAGNHLDKTIASLEAATALLPHVRSTATLLAAKYVIAGRHAEAHTLMDETYLADAPPFDPVRTRVGAWALAGPFDQLREMIRR